MSGTIQEGGAESEHDNRKGGERKLLRKPPEKRSADGAARRLYRNPMKTMRQPHSQKLPLKVFNNGSVGDIEGENIPLI